MPILSFSLVFPRILYRPPCVIRWPINPVLAAGSLYGRKDDNRIGGIVCYTAGALGVGGIEKSRLAKWLIFLRFCSTLRNPVLRHVHTPFVTASSFICDWRGILRLFSRVSTIIPRSFRSMNFFAVYTPFSKVSPSNSCVFFVYDNSGG